MLTLMGGQGRLGKSTAQVLTRHPQGEHLVKKFLNTRKKIAAVALTGAAAAGIAGSAFAYFTTTGNGTGTGAVGTSSTLTVHQASITYSNSASENALVPGTSATVTFTVDNPSSGNQQLGTISVSSITTDAAHAGCDTADHSSWFTTGTDLVGNDYGPGTGQAVTGTLTVTMNDVAAVQDVCKGAPLTFNYSSN